MSTSSRSAILAAARALIARDGAGVSMGEVAREAGVSRQAVYLHFGSRAGLFVALVRAMDEEAEIRPALERAMAAEDPAEALRRFVREWVRFASAIRPVASMLLAARAADPAAAAAWEDRASELRAGFRAVTVRLAEAGRLRDGLTASSAADLAWALSSVPVLAQLEIERGWRTERVERELAEAVLAALVT